VTDPVSSPPTVVAPETVAVRLTEAPAFAEEVPVIVVVVGIGVTTNIVGGAELLAALSVSPE
jgi:hypothetical protein